MAYLDVVAVARDELRLVDGGCQTDPRPVAFAIKVGRDDKGLIGERVVVGQPRSRATAQLVLPAAPPSGESVGVGQQQHRSGGVGVDVVERSVQAGPPGEVACPVGNPGDAVAVRAGESVLSGDDGHPQRDVGGAVVGASAEHVAIVEERGPPCTR